MRDANMEALAKHEREIEKAERIETSFIEEVLNSDVIIRYEDLVMEFQTIASRYDINMSFSKFIDENV